MKYLATKCPTCGKAMMKCADERLMPQSVKAVNRSYGWAWNEKQCEDCWIMELTQDAGKGCLACRNYQ